MKTYKVSVQTSASNFSHLTILAQNFKSAWSKARKVGMVISIYEIQ